MNKRGIIYLVVMALLVPACGLLAAGYDTLLPLLIDLPGWEAEAADGADASASGVRAFTAYRTYESGERRFETNILASTQADASWAPEYKEGYKVETPEGIIEVRRINGFLVTYMFEKGSKSGSIVVMLQNAATKADLEAVFAISFEGLTLEEALKTSQRFDWSKMKAQAAKLK